MIRPINLQRLVGDAGRVAEGVSRWAEHVRDEVLSRLIPDVHTAADYLRPGRISRSEGQTYYLEPPTAVNRGRVAVICADSDLVAIAQSGTVAGTTQTSVTGDALLVSDGQTRWAVIHGARPGWRDSLGEIREGAAASALSWEAYRGGSWIAPFMRHDQDDAVSMRHQLNHDWDRKTPVRGHIHWEPQSNPATTEIVSFSGSYSWAPVLKGRDDPANWSTFWVTDTVTAGDAFTGKVTTLFEATPPPQMGASTMLRVQFQRDGTGTTDTYTTNKSGGTIQANLLLDYADVHYFADRVGTVGEYADR